MHQYWRGGRQYWEQVCDNKLQVLMISEDYHVQVYKKVIHWFIATGNLVLVLMHLLVCDVQVCAGVFYGDALLPEGKVSVFVTAVMLVSNTMHRHYECQVKVSPKWKITITGVMENSTMEETITSWISVFCTVLLPEPYFLKLSGVLVGSSVPGYLSSTCHTISVGSGG